MGGKEIRVILDENFNKKIEELKKHYGLKNTTELIRFLITEKYREISVKGEKNDP